MSEEYLSYMFSLEKNKEIPIKTLPKPKKENLYDDCFEMTEKISSNPKYINDFVIDEKILGRKFCNKKGEIKYLEIFNNKKLELIGISPNITFLHAYEPKLKFKYNENDFIGFRYYETGFSAPNSKYFTLIKRYDSKYDILEKNEKIKDINGEKFFNQNLNCFSLINRIIINKYKNKKNIKNGETFPELLGFCYGLKSIKKFKNFICIEPLIPESFNQSSLEETIEYDLEDNVSYLEPLLCDSHISLIVFSKVNNTRFNIILDMSRYHSSEKHLNSSIYPQNVIIQNLRFPPKSIQNYSSCCLWFYGEIDCLMNNNNYNSFESLFNNVKDEKIDFYIDVINEIGFKFYDIFQLFRLEEEQGQNQLELDRLFISDKEKKYSVHKNIIFTRFLDISSFFFDLSFFQTIVDYEILIDSQKRLVEYITFKNLLELNKKYYEYDINNKDREIIIKFISYLISVMNDILRQYRDKYDIEFCKYSISSLKNINESNNIDEPKEIIKNINENNYLSTLTNLHKMYLKCYSLSKKKYAIYSIEQIIKKLNPSNEICYQIFYK